MSTTNAVSDQPSSHLSSTGVVAQRMIVHHIDPQQCREERLEPLLLQSKRSSPDDSAAVSDEYPPTKKPALGGDVVLPTPRKTAAEETLKRSSFDDVSDEAQPAKKMAVQLFDAGLLDTDNERKITTAFKTGPDPGKHIHVSQSSVDAAALVLADEDGAAECMTAAWFSAADCRRQCSVFYCCRPRYCANQP